MINTLLCRLENEIERKVDTVCLEEEILSMRERLADLQAKKLWSKGGDDVVHEIVALEKELDLAREELDGLRNQEHVPEPTADSSSVGTAETSKTSKTPVRDRTKHHMLRNLNKQLSGLQRQEMDPDMSEEDRNELRVQAARLNRQIQSMMDAIKGRSDAIEHPKKVAGEVGPPQDDSGELEAEGQMEGSSLQSGSNPNTAGHESGVLQGKPEEVTQDSTQVSIVDVEALNNELNTLQRKLNQTSPKLSTEEREELIARILEIDKQIDIAVPRRKSSRKKTNRRNRDRGIESLDPEQEEAEGSERPEQSSSSMAKEGSKSVSSSTSNSANTTATKSSNSGCRARDLAEDEQAERFLAKVRTSGQVTLYGDN